MGAPGLTGDDAGYRRLATQRFLAGRHTSLTWALWGADKRAMLGSETTPAANGRRQLSRSDRDALESLRSAELLYAEYLRIADVANVSKLVVPPAELVTPRLDLPLTLAGTPACRLGAS